MTEQSNENSNQVVLRSIKVFIASPGDLLIERRMFKETLDELNGGYGRGAKVEFQPLRWEDAFSSVGRRPQAIINQDIDRADVFVLLMWRRWGQIAPDSAPYTSYTEEEFNRALARYEEIGKPEIFVFLKHIDPGQMADPGDELKKVLEFRKKLEASRKVLYKEFDDPTSLSTELDRHLVAFADGKLPTPALDAMRPIIPRSVQDQMDKQNAEMQSAVEELKVLRAEAERLRKEAETARAAAKNRPALDEATGRLQGALIVEKSIEIAEHAARAALEGRIEEARQGFAKAVDGTTNPRILYLGYEFFERIGELSKAEELLRQALALSGSLEYTTEKADYYGNLGNIRMAQGDLNGAEAMYRKSLMISEKLGRLERVAASYGNLGVVFKARGDLMNAESMYLKALVIEEQLGRLDGIAKVYGNLGNILYSRGDLDAAEEMHRGALSINTSFGEMMGTSNNLCGLGFIFEKRGNLLEAEAMYRKSLAINEKLGWIEGIAAACGNLGKVLRRVGDLDGAETFYSKSLICSEKLGREVGVASSLHGLGNVLLIRGNLSDAEAAYRRSLAIAEKLRDDSLIAAGCFGLGNVMKTRGDFEPAKSMLTRAFELFIRAGDKSNADAAEILLNLVNEAKPS